MEKKTSAKFLAMLLCFCVLGIMAGGDDSLAGKCSSKFQKVTDCLEFATAKAATPNKKCCDSVTDLKDTDPACLCYVIQLIHNGSNPQVKSLGIQESRLLQLPSACKLANASITECPKLLNLPPNSPDAAIFTNTSAATTTPVASPGAASSTTPSNGCWHEPQIAGCLIGAMVIFFHAFPTGLMPS